MAEIAFGELTVTVAPSAIPAFVAWLKADPNCRFTTLIDITAVDWPAREARFDVVYHFLSMHLNQRIRVKAVVREDELVPSIMGEFPSADWYEREVFDMYGILFSGHPDLRRILTDYGFRGYPLRKDFPTTGYVELRYDEEAEARGLRAGEADAGVPPVRLHEPVGGRGVHPARRREEGGVVNRPPADRAAEGGLADRRDALLRRRAAGRHELASRDVPRPSRAARADPEGGPLLGHGPAAARRWYRRKAAPELAWFRGASMLARVRRYPLRGAVDGRASERLLAARIALYDAPSPDHASYRRCSSTAAARGRCSSTTRRPIAARRDTFAEMAALADARFVFVMRDPVAGSGPGSSIGCAPGTTGDGPPEAVVARFTRRVEAPDDRDLARSDYRRTIEALEAAVPEPGALPLLRDAVQPGGLCRLTDFLGIARGRARPGGGSTAAARSTSGPTRRCGAGAGAAGAGLRLRARPVRPRGTGDVDAVTVRAQRTRGVRWTATATTF